MKNETSRYLLDMSRLAEAAGRRVRRQQIWCVGTLHVSGNCTWCPCFRVQQQRAGRDAPPSTCDALHRQPVSTARNCNNVLHACMYACMYVYVCMHACMHACMLCMYIRSILVTLRESRCLLRCVFSWSSCDKFTADFHRKGSRSRDI